MLLDSNKAELGKAMPDFSLADPTGQSFSRSELMGEKGLVIVFTCNHCPYAIAIWERLVALSQDIEPLGINTVAINPNHTPDYPEDSPENMLKLIDLK